MRKGWTAALFVASLAGPLPALAFQDPPTTQPTAPKRIIFENETVTGTPTGPEAEKIEVILPPRLRSLVQVRADFRDALLQSAADL
jgi:hypothetical protein